MSNPDKIYETVKKITVKLKEILEENPDYCGSIITNFYMGGISNIEKRETIKIK